MPNTKLLRHGKPWKWQHPAQKFPTQSSLPHQCHWLLTRVTEALIVGWIGEAKIKFKMSVHGSRNVS
jgi:hypothetical protein